MTAVVELRNVRKLYRSVAEDVTALAGVSLSIEAGRLLALVGPSGSGKTTLVNIVVGWDRADAGDVMVADGVGDDWSGTALIPQDLGLLDELTLRENVSLPVILGNSPAVDVEDLLVEVDLAGVAAQVPPAVSLGEQQRAAVGRALVTGPRLLVADEPTSHQDERNTVRIAALLRRAARQGSAVMVATHDERALDYADAIVEMRDGVLVPA